MTRTKEVRKKQSELNLLMAQKHEDRHAVRRFDAELSPEGRRMMRQAMATPGSWQEEKDLIREQGSRAEREKRDALMTRRSRLSRGADPVREEAASQIHSQVHSRQVG